MRLEMQTELEDIEANVKINSIVKRDRKPPDTFQVSFQHKQTRIEKGV